MTARSSSWICIGCGCSDRRACPGGCSWVRPGVCSSCDGKDIFKPSQIVVDILVKAIGRTTRRNMPRRQGYRRIVPSRSVPAIAMLALLGDELLLSTDRRNLADGMALRPTTRLFLGFDGVWKFSLVWHRRDEHGMTHSETHIIRQFMGKRFAWGGR